MFLYQGQVRAVAAVPGAATRNGQRCQGPVRAEVLLSGACTRIWSDFSRACQLFCVSDVELDSVSLALLVCRDPVGESDHELGEGLFPVRGVLALDEAVRDFAFTCAFMVATVFHTFAGAFVFNVADR